VFTKMCGFGDTKDEQTKLINYGINLNKLTNQMQQFYKFIT